MMTSNDQVLTHMDLHVPNMFYDPESINDL